MKKILLLIVNHLITVSLFSQVWDGNSIEGNTFRNGNVGIGIIQPSSKLEILQNGNGTNVSLLTLSNPFQTVNTGVTLKFSPTSSPESRYSAISGFQEGDNRVALRFITGEGSVISEKMRITASGRVGLGVIQPTCKLDILQGNDGGNVNLLTFFKQQIQK